ncbi:hypothetical protein [Butyrivibrio sp. LC3010]|uniref:hypothetical protein n=1 Tax=Butyrivibrio sp. LC3010 TaxID=1280680 RepID=UPI0004078699|nr:hypothetical protein [Butyrivibrio sp. LC3010]
MSYNKSLDFLDMIKNTKSNIPDTKTDIHTKNGHSDTKHEVQKKTGHSDTKYDTYKNPEHSDPKYDTYKKSEHPDTKYDTQKKTVHPETKKAVSNTEHAETVISLKRTISRHNPDNKIAVIDTETNWNNEVMSVGIVLADMDTYKCVGAKYYIIDPEYKKGGMYSDVLRIVKSIPQTVTSREAAMRDICDYLTSNNTKHIFAYNAKFDHGHLKELHDFKWFDIMRLAAYRQFNHAIPADAEVCKSGRLKRGYSVESILQMLSSDYCYRETHNAVMDAMDELKIMELLRHDISSYECAKL